MINALNAGADSAVAAPTNCRQEPTALSLRNKTTEPQKSMLAGTNAISALRDAVVAWIALKFNDNRSAEKSFMRGAKLVGITSFQRDFVGKREPYLRNNGNCVFFRVVAQLGAKM